MESNSDKLIDPALAKGASIGKDLAAARHCDADATASDVSAAVADEANADDASAPGTPGASLRVGHAAALFTIAVWGLTFIATKILLREFEPFEILIMRFALGFLCLAIARPHILKLKERRHELFFIAAGLTGVVMYFLLENIALTMAQASNIGVVTGTAPIFIAVIAAITGRERSLGPSFIAGFAIAMVGVVICSVSDASTVNVGLGDLLAVGGAFVWGIYSNIVAKLNDWGYETIAATKRIFAWGILFLLLLTPIFGFEIAPSDFVAPETVVCILFLGIIASGCTFATWGIATRHLGPARTGAYIYLQVPITVVASIIILREAFTLNIAFGIILVLFGLALSEGLLSREKMSELLGK